MRYVWFWGKSFLQRGRDSHISIGNSPVQEREYTAWGLRTADCMCGKSIYFVALVSVLISAGSAFTAGDPSLVIHYSFDNVGTTVADQSGKGHNGTVQGSVTADPGGKHNGAAKFAGGGYLDLDGDNFPVADIPTSAITLAAWVKCENTGEHHAIFDARTDAGTWIIHPELRGDGRFRWALRAHGMSVIFDIQAGSVTWGQWLHYAGTYDKESGKAILYVNGQVVSELDLPGGTDVAGDWGDGARVGLSIGNARAFTGLMDDFYLFKRALPPSEIKKIMYGQGWPYASSPSPADTATHPATSVRLDWSAGQSAVSHGVYLGEIFDDVNNGAASTFYGNQSSTSFVAGLPGYAYPQGLASGTTYYWRIDEIEAGGTLHKGDVWSFRIPPSTAYDPEPADGAKFINTNVKLGWTKGLNAVLQSVYFGQSFDDVNSAATGRTQPAIVTTYAPGTLELGKTYYWRIDERNATGWQKGKVWRFTTAGTGGGLRADYYAGVDLKERALTRTDPQINFNWSLSGPDPKVGNDNFSIRWTGELDVPISETYSFYPTVQGGLRLWVDGRLLLDKWQDYGIDERWQEHYPVEYYSAIDLEAGTYSVVMEFAYRQSFGGGAVVQLAWGSPSTPRQVIPQAAFSLPVRANRPSPSNDTVDTRQTVTLGWSPGNYASLHQVYFGSDEEAVRNAAVGSPEYKGNKPLGSESYDPGKLAWDTPYYWRVDEVNNLRPESPWIGSVWSFTTADFLIVDDFELYNDLDPADPASNRIFLAWLDGYGTTTNGAVVGYESPNWAAGEHFVETNIVHGGRQSMPYFYNNNFKYSQAELSLKPAQDWTEHGVKTLSLWFHGSPDNAAERMYVVVNGSAVVYHNDPAAAKIDTWMQWSIDLQEFANRGVNLTGVNAIALGFGTKGNVTTAGGSGRVFFDDIRLYPPTEPAP